MMAAAEARAAWQRTANRCFVQEDAKRAPKLASCPSASSKLQQDQCPGDARNRVENSGTYFLPINWNSSNSNLSPDTKWWLQLQPNFGNQRDLIFEQLKALDVELDCTASLDMDSSSEPSDEVTQTAQGGAANPEKVGLSGFGEPCPVSTTCLNHEFESKAHDCLRPLKHEMNLNDPLQTESSENMSINQKQLDHLILDQREKDSVDISVPWLTDKAGPWWRITDKYELASLVAQSSFRCIENCDLPRPLNAHRSSLDDVEVFHDAEMIPSSFGHRHRAAFYGTTGDPQQNPFSLIANGARWLPAGLDPSGLEKNSSSSRANNKQFGDSGHGFGVDASKAQLLEALCHSQTRARKAENAAQRAHSEKEHILKLFLKQATHLFAYKQLLRLLQLESICLQIERKDNPMVPWDQISALFPWLSTRDEQLGESGRKKRKRSSENPYDVGRLAFAVAIGMSLAGAGLFLGWTLGWLLSTF